MMAHTKSVFAIVISVFLTLACTNRHGFQLGKDNLIVEITNSITVDLMKNEVILALPNRDVKKIDSVLTDKERTIMMKGIDSFKIGELEGTRNYNNSRFYELPSSNFTINLISLGVLKNKLIVNEDFDGCITEERIRIDNFKILLDSIFRQNKKISKMLAEERAYHKNTQGLLL